MQGKTVVMTGATSGIGEVAAESLAEGGARIVFIARDKARAEATLKRLAARSALRHRAVIADLSSLAEAKRAGAEIAAEEQRINALVNNAGAIFSKRRLTADRLEMTFALNHMSYFVLTEALRERLVASAPARIVSTASDAHTGAKLDFDDLQAEKSYSAMRAYGRSKLCNILFTRELARRLAGTGVIANCLHPGFVATRFGDQAGGAIGRFVGLAKLFAITPEKGADTIVYLASSPDVATVSGKYFIKRRAATPSAAAQDDEAARRLWAASEALAAGESQGAEKS
ncbi:MAG TPA: SDR family oxidoreductase [Roseiarcus sp.]|nr:SDR family oxidoreductase [Roseiarcus sp.]